MYFTLTELSVFFNMPQSALARELEGKKLRADIIDGQTKVHKLDAIDWAARSGLALPAELTEEGRASLKAALLGGGIVYDAQGDTKEAVIQNIAAICAPVINLEQQMLSTLLLARENLCPTSVGNGIAFPHPRAPIIFRIPCPVINLMFLKTPVDFGALDGKPVHTLFTILAASARDHLRLLAALSHALHHPQFSKAITGRAAKEEIIAAAEAADKTKKSI